MDEWITDPFSVEMIKDVDKSTVVAPHLIESPVLGPISPKELSGGVKTLILIYKDRSHLFNASNCGDNCSKWLLKMAENEDITINLRHLMDFGNGKFEIEVLNNGKIIHDMTNHLCTLQLMAEKNMTHEIIQYVQKLIPEVKRGRVTDVTNSILAVILFEKRAKAKQHNVHLECDVRVDDIKMPMHELNSILNNVIDNAIEATEKVKNKRERIVEFCVYVKQNNLVMECINPYAEEPKIDSEGMFRTSKTDKNSHGKGIRIIYDYVLQNNGDVDIRYCNGKFSIKIIFTDEIAVLE